MMLTGYAIQLGGKKCLHRSSSLLQPDSIHHSNGILSYQLMVVMVVVFDRIDQSWMLN